MTEAFILFEEKVRARVNALNEQIKRLCMERTRHQQEEERRKIYAQNCTVAIEVARMERIALIEAAKKKEEEHTV